MGYDMGGWHDYQQDAQRRREEEKRRQEAKKFKNVGPVRKTIRVLTLGLSKIVGI